jgi:ketosteroid isomerase-like protein
LTSKSDHINRLADALFGAFERNDVAAIGACCEEDAVFWKNGHRSGLARDLLPSFATLHERIGHHRYTEVRRELFATGFVEEHRVATVLPSGDPFSIVACVVGRVGRTGLISELAEYVDPASGRGRPL